MITDEPILIHYYQLKSSVYSRVHFLCIISYGSCQVYPYSSTTQNNFTILWIPTSPPSHHPLLPSKTLEITTCFTVPLVMPFRKRHTVEIIQCVVFSDCLLSLHNKHLSSLHVPWLDSSFLFITNLLTLYWKLQHNTTFKSPSKMSTYVSCYNIQKGLPRKFILALKLSTWGQASRKSSERDEMRFLLRFKIFSSFRLKGKHTPDILFLIIRNKVTLRCINSYTLKEKIKTKCLQRIAAKRVY